MIKIAAALISAAMGAGALFGYVASVTFATTNHLSRPGTYCVQEDSCKINYSGVSNRMLVLRDTP